MKKLYLMVGMALLTCGVVSAQGGGKLDVGYQLSEQSCIFFPSTHRTGLLVCPKQGNKWSFQSAHKSCRPAVVGMKKVGQYQDPNSSRLCVVYVRQTEKGETKVGRKITYNGDDRCIIFPDNGGPFGQVICPTDKGAQQWRMTNVLISPEKSFGRLV